MCRLQSRRLFQVADDGVDTAARLPALQGMGRGVDGMFAIRGIAVGMIGHEFGDDGLVQGLDELAPFVDVIRQDGRFQEDDAVFAFQGVTFVAERVVGRIGVHLDVTVIIGRHRADGQLLD